MAQAPLAQGRLAQLSPSRAIPPTTVLRPATAGESARLAKAAQDFEAMALGELLQPMFDTVDTAHGLFGGGDAEAAWRPLLVQEMARQIASHGGLGLAAPVQAAMLRMQQAKSR
ncbi:rod-binding protein [Rhodopila sp.]|uniref:rod-binding protein n=1 Tax=Rhodopila sp. TaxID=2480087 RepID=UPI002BAA2F25|nr:rod-binding protein [Rhodopila sp.]HVZ10500.1 rod-binding protein [Rhodopila sp.]